MYCGDMITGIHCSDLRVLPASSKSLGMYAYVDKDNCNVSREIKYMD